MVAAVLDVVSLATAAVSELAVLVDHCSAAGPVQLAAVDLVLSAAAAAQPFGGLVSAATGQHAGVIDQHSLVLPSALSCLDWQHACPPPPSSWSLSSSVLLPLLVLALSLPASVSLSLPDLQAEHNSRVLHLLGRRVMHVAPVKASS